MRFAKQTQQKPYFDASKIFQFCFFFRDLPPGALATVTRERAGGRCPPRALYWAAGSPAQYKALGGERPPAKNALTFDFVPLPLAAVVSRRRRPERSEARRSRAPPPTPSGGGGREGAGGEGKKYRLSFDRRYWRSWIRAASHAARAQSAGDTSRAYLY